MPTPAITPPSLGDLWYLVPELIVVGWGFLLLIVDFAALRGRTGPQRRRTLGGLALVGALATLGYLLWPLVAGDPAAESPADPVIFFGSLAGDLLTRQLNGVLAVLLALVISLSMAWDFTEQWGEYFALLFWATAGMMLLIAAEELIVLFLTLETMTICLYLATALEKGRRRSAEAGLKYFVYGSVSSALFLFGLSLVYGLTGTTSLEGIRLALLDRGVSTGLAGNVAGATAVLMVLVGFGFKIAAVPFHQWAPDTYEGAPAPVSAWIAAGSKLASFVAMMKVLVYALKPWASEAEAPTSPGWVMIVALIAAATMTYGNFAALAQRNLKRMLAYSSIAHGGYILIGVLAAAVSIKREAAAGSVLFYLVTYAFTTIGAFAVAAWLVRDRGRDDIEDLAGLGRESPLLATCIVLLMLSLIGMPPLAGFFSKLYLFFEAINTRDSARVTMLALVALALFNSVVSAFYYVRVLKAMFLRPSSRSWADAPASISWPIMLATLVALIFGIYPALLLDPMVNAAVPMLSTSAQAGSSDPRLRVEQAPMTADEIAEERRREQENDARAQGMAPPGGGAPPAPRPKADTPPEPTPPSP